MDLNTGIICVSVIAISAIVLFLVSFFGFKEKTYEEALAEQRQKGLGLHLTKSQPVVKEVKTKEVKHKKLGKKAKEKGSENRNESHPSPKIEEKPPLEVTKVEAEVKTEPASPGDQKEKKKKEKKLKASKEEIAVLEGEKREKKRKERKSKLVSVEEDVAHTESLESGGEDVSPTIASKKPSTEKPVHQKELAKVDKSEHPPKTHKTQTVVSETTPDRTAETKVKAEEVSKAKNEIHTQTQIQAQIEPVVPTKEKTMNMSAKERKKKKNEINTLLEADGPDDVLSGKGLLPLLHKAVLTDGEIQNLIEALLNKQQQGGAGSEWLDASGRLDPVSALKKQLSEKEEALKEEQDTSQAYQVKLRDLRAELNHSLHKRRTLEESSIKLQQEIQALHARIQHNHDQHIAEIQTMQSHLQQVQSKMSEEHVRQVRQLQEEKNQLQQAMTQLEQQYNSSQMELETLRTTQDQYDTRHAAMQQAQNDLAAQVQQLEDHMRKQEQQKREDEESHKTQICQLSTQLMESENTRSTLSASIEKLQESQESVEYRNAMLQKKVSMLETLSAKVSELTSQLEEANKVKLEVDLRIKDMESKTEKLTASLSEREKEMMQLQEENEALVVQLTSATTRPAAEGQEENAEKQISDALQREAEPKTSSIDIKQYDMLITEKDGTIEKLSNEICEKDGAIDKISSEICGYKSELRNIREELDTQRKKNNVLREKNWKAMEALSAAEKSLEIKMKESDKLVSEYCHNAVEEQTVVRELLQRLFPTVCVESCKEHDLWIERFESEAHKYIQELSHSADSEQKATQCQEDGEDLTARLTESEEQISKLQAQVGHYKIVLNETEGILNKLQNSVESEEKVWEQKLEGKDVELETVQKEKESLNDQMQLMEDQIQSLQEQLRTMEDSMEQLHAVEEMQEKLRELQEKLQGEETEKRILALKCDQADKSYTDLHKQLDEAQEQLASLHDLKKELEEAKLAAEQERKTNKDLSTQMVKLNSLVRIGQDAVNAEQETVRKLQEQLAQAKAPTETATANGPASASPVEQPASKTLERKTTPSRTSQPTTSEKKHKNKRKSGSTKK